MSDVPDSALAPYMAWTSDALGQACYEEGLPHSGTKKTRATRLYRENILPVAVGDRAPRRRGIRLDDDSLNTAEKASCGHADCAGQECPGCGTTPCCHHSQTCPVHYPEHEQVAENGAVATTPTGRSMGSHQSHNAQTTTWLTPPHITDALGPFDLDPCAAPGWPTAAEHYVLPQDGLVLPWHGMVWLNPPYGAAVWTWLDRLHQHGSGIALIFARTETAGFVEQVWGKADAVLFLHGRLYFHRPDGTRAEANSGAPSCLVAYGAEAHRRLAGCDLPGSLVSSWRPAEHPIPPASVEGGEPR